MAADAAADVVADSATQPVVLLFLVVLYLVVLAQLVAVVLLTKLFSVKFTFQTVLKFRFLTRLLLTVKFLSSTLTT